MAGLNSSTVLRLFFISLNPYVTRFAGSNLMDMFALGVSWAVSLLTTVNIMAQGYALSYYNFNTRTDIENKDSATMVKALRQTSKNIMFTIVRSGNYTKENLNGGLDKMTTMFIAIDVVAAVVIVAVMAILIVNYRRKHYTKD